jgi:hypothetical protein
MGCSSSKAIKDRDNDSVITATISPDKPERLYKLVVKAQKTADWNQREEVLNQILHHAKTEPKAASYCNPTTKSTPLHMASRLLDSCSANKSEEDLLSSVIETLVKLNKEALKQADAGGHVPLHYAIAPSTHFQGKASSTNWKFRASVLRKLIDADPDAAKTYLSLHDVKFESRDATGGCTPLYRVLQTLQDDFEASGPTVEYAAVVQQAYSLNAGVGNASDGDKPLALLYRRFTRQFDISEKFFSGDNSRPEVVEHRKLYKTAAGNTWKIIELLLRPPSNDTAWGIVHRAVQVETPPDLLRYIVETNAQDLTRVDKEGNLPLHHAAKSKPPLPQQERHKQFPAFYTKYVVDELLYKFPEAASMTDGNGQYPLTLAIQSGKQWIGGGIKSLYDAFPDALQQIDLEKHHDLQKVLSMMEDDTDDQEQAEEDAPDGVPKGKGIIKDEHHDAIMLVQQPNVDVSEVVTSMWAHEEDAGVQMLGCVAIAKMSNGKGDAEIMRIALSAVAAVVNAMKAHPNEMIVQEKACLALKNLAKADGHREVSMVASGAVAAIVGAMQAHVGDPGVQEEACCAISAVVNHGGSDRATVVASVSGVTAILNAIAAHPRSKGVQIGGVEALEALTQFDDANMPDLPRSQTEPLLEIAKNTFPDECLDICETILKRMS